VTLAVVSVPAAAQTSDPSQFSKALDAGDTIVIVDPTGGETRARVARVDDTSLDVHLITPGTAPNEYVVSSTLRSVPIEQILAVYRADALGERRRPLYQRQNSFGMLPDRVKRGQVLHLIEPSGIESAGKVVDVSRTSLVVALRKANARDSSGRPVYEFNTPKAFSPAGVEKVERRGPIWDGAVKGAVIAALVTTIAVAKSGCFGCTGVGPGYIATIGIGTGLGLGIDALFGPARVYGRK
jgi:hypothetical protein